MKRLVYIAGCSEDNDIGNYIKADIRNIKSIFEAHENEGHVILRTDEFATKSDFRKRFMDNNILPWLFYFSGHSAPDFIQFSDGKIKTNNFVKFFENEAIVENLQLIYLGSCDSLFLGQKLIENKVKVVIASDRKVPAHLSNIISQNFFIRFLLMKNIQSAFDHAVNDYEMDRSRFNVGEEQEFPWHILTSSETNLIKPIKHIRLSSEMKHDLLLNSASIRLEFLEYYLNEDKSSEKNVEQIKEETMSIKNNLNMSLNLNINDPNGNISSLVKLWKEAKPLQSFPNQQQILRTNKKIANLRIPEIFVEKTQDHLSDLLERSKQILDQF